MTKENENEIYQYLKANNYLLNDLSNEQNLLKELNDNYEI